MQNDSNDGRDGAHEFESNKALYVSMEEIGMDCLAKLLM